ncbi:trans-aconitate 2-methyltransferase [Singulisphaera sp. GP187]|uniref:class I SAM-dependent methyltransferase n=1 Tax=Singulisphaera sp. GP187 TaxID=1882752 RepID=UPI000927E41D|nr:class I SAM-dependent methyltransferase [Singulisphaera sp. GP187]SIN72042.1 trans-aconitate 2-methyltransferase [Singulisphaera sp. GP187]
MTATEKDFAPIQSDYEFFVTHATEAEADLAAYLDWLRECPLGAGPVRILDFGCGPGTFTEPFLDRAGWPAGQVELTLVEPVDDYRRAAIERLQGHVTSPVQAWAQLPEGLADSFDLALSNHVFYYVPALREEIARIVHALKPDGLFLASIAGKENVLIQIWIEAFAVLGRPVPYHTAEDFEDALVALAFPFRRRDVQYTLAFPDSEPNRWKILHFLLGEHLEQLPRATALGFLDRFSIDQRIEMNAKHFQYCVRRSLGSP